MGEGLRCGSLKYGIEVRGGSASPEGPRRNCGLRAVGPDLGPVPADRLSVRVLGAGAEQTRRVKGQPRGLSEETSGARPAAALDAPDKYRHSDNRLSPRQSGGLSALRCP